MEWAAKLREQFLEAAHAGGPLALYDAVVTDIDLDAYTCDIVCNESPIYDVRLRAVVSDNHSLEIIPVIGSAIVVGMMGDDDYIVVACDKISMYRVTVGDTVFTMDSGGILISKGTETLNKILNDLVQAIIGIGAFKDMPGLAAIKIRINNLLK